MSELSTLGAGIATAYEGEIDTNKFTDAEKAKLAAIGPAVTSCFDASGYDFRLLDDAGNLVGRWDAGAKRLSIGSGTAVRALSVFAPDGDGLQVVGGAGGGAEACYVALQNRATFGYDGGQILISDANTAGVSTSKNLAVSLGGSERWRFESGGRLIPGGDGTQDFGGASSRVDTIYAATGTINTSDERAKCDIGPLDEAEKRAAIGAKALLKKYRYKDAVALKGDAARWHFGIIAQDLIAAFKAEGLDAMEYGCVCFNEWWTSQGVKRVRVAPEKYDGKGIEVEPAKYDDRPITLTHTSADDAPEGAEYHSRYGVRYEELLAFIVAAM